MVITDKEIMILAPLQQLPDGNQRERKQKSCPPFAFSSCFYLVR